MSVKGLTREQRYLKSLFFFIMEDLSLDNSNLMSMYPRNSSIWNSISLFCSFLKYSISLESLPFFIYAPILSKIQQHKRYLVLYIPLSLLKKTNKDVVGILDFDDYIIYEPIVQYRIMISMFEETLKNNMVMQKFHLYRLKKY